MVSGLLLGVSLQAAEVQLTWDANPEPNIAGYRLYRGTTPGIYDRVENVGLTTVRLVTQLAGGTLYYFTLTALNTDGLESQPSNIFSYRPPVDNQSTPTATPASFALGEDTTLAIVLTGSDPNGNTLTYQITSQPTRGTLTGTPPRLNYQPAANFNGTDSFAFVVRNSTTASTPATINLTVQASNDRPVAFAQTNTVARNTPTPIVLVGGDIDGDSIAFGVRTQPVNGTLSGTPPNLTYQPKANFIGADSFTFLVSDGRLSSGATTVSLNVISSNEPPLAQSATVSIAQDTSQTIRLIGSDPNGDALSYRIVSAPLRGVLSGTPPNVTYQPNAGFVGSDRFSFEVNDGAFTSAPATVSIDVTSVATVPVATAQSVSLAEDTSVALTLSGSSANGSALTYEITTAPARGVLTGTPPNLTYQPSSNLNGTDRFFFVVRAGSVTSTPAAVEINVTPVNDPPLAYDQTLSVVQDSSLSVRLTGFDVEGTNLSFVVTTDPQFGVLQGIAPELTYVPQPGFTGVDQFKFVTTDRLMGSAEATIRISVQSTVTTPPLAQPDFLVVTQGGSTGTLANGNESILDNDAAFSATPLTAQLITPPQFGTLDMSVNGRFRYTHDGGGSIEDTFIYRASREGVFSENTTVRISVFRLTGAQRTANQLSLSFSSINGANYEVESAQGVPSPNGNWQSLSGVIPGIHGTLQYRPDLPAGASYYRIVCRTASQRWVTEPIGFYPINFGNGYNLLSTPLHNFPNAIVTVSGLDQDTVVVAGNPWRISEFDEQNNTTQYALMVRSTSVNSPARAGDWWPITLTAADRVRVQNRGSDLRSNLAVGDEIEIRRLTSLTDILGPTPESWLIDGDDFQLVSPTGTQVEVTYATTGVATPGFYIVSPNRALSGPHNPSQFTVPPGTGFQWNRAGGPGTIPLIGRVQTFGMTHYAPTSALLFGTPYPATTSMDALGLIQSGWINEIPGSGLPKDEIWVIESKTPLQIITRRQVSGLSNTWYVNGILNQQFALPPGRAAWIIFAGRANPIQWRQPTPW